MSVTATKPERARGGAGRFHPLRVAEVERLTDDSIAITFDVPDELRETFRFIQGQHVAIRCELAGDDVRRSYSICTPATSGQLRVAVKLLEGGAFSGYAHTELEPGDALEVLPPHGSFFTALDRGQRKRYVAIAAGSGISPVLSLIATALEVEGESEFTLLYGNRTSRSIMFLEELEDLKNAHPDRLALFHVLSRESRGVDLLDGRIDGARLRSLCAAGVVGPDAADEWFVCGPLAMVQELVATLAALGVDPHRVHRELFFTGDVPTAPATRTTELPGAEVCEVTIRLDGRESRFEIDPALETILEGALSVRADAPYACRGGVCATCRARLLEGEVEMDHDYALELEQREAGYVLTCQSRPTTRKVTVDYDA
jgi:ring-1,2-phenylacetyl-CoA epoxidase subunit PaaE